jgi:hypothetical protein
MSRPTPSSASPPDLIGALSGLADSEEGRLLLARLAEAANLALAPRSHVAPLPVGDPLEREGPRPPLEAGSAGQPRLDSHFSSVSELLHAERRIRVPSESECAAHASGAGASRVFVRY